MWLFGNTKTVVVQVINSVIKGHKKQFYYREASASGAVSCCLCSNVSLWFRLRSRSQTPLH